MWKIITIILIILVVIFGYITYKKYSPEGGVLSSVNGSSATSTEDDAGENFFKSDFMSMMNDTIGDVSILPESSDSASAPIITEEELGELSPYYGKISIDGDGSEAYSDDVSEEYVSLVANEENTEVIAITNWSLQSMVTGLRAYIHDGVDDLKIGTVNETHIIEMQPGQTAIVSSSESPIGVSFQTNKCTGYLGSVQEYNPSLAEKCPEVRDVFPASISNLQKYGSSCLSFASRLPSCEYLRNVPKDSGISQACIDALQKKLTYTSCAYNFSQDADFYEESQWRIFIGSNKTLWAPEYEVIRLLDDMGRTVDVFRY